jgi:hypothetical protein
MNRISKCLITLVVLLSLAFSQSRINHQKPINQQIHENIYQALLMNQVSEGARPTEEVYQGWSEVNNQWGNFERYTYEYNPQKVRVGDVPHPGLNIMTWWNWDDTNNTWFPVEHRNHYYQSGGTISHWIAEDAVSSAPLYRCDYTGPIYNDLATTVTRTYYTGSTWYNSTQIQRTFNETGWPITTNDYNWGGTGWVLSWSTNTEYHPALVQWGCPQTSTDNYYTNGLLDGTSQTIYTYAAQSSCTQNAPYTAYWFHNRCTHIGAEWYSYDPNTDTWTRMGYKIPDFETGSCLYRGLTVYLDNGTPLGKWRAYWWTSTGKVSSNRTTVDDNSEARLTRIETEFWDGTKWVNSTRSWYSYEGIQMDTEVKASIPAIYELKQNYPNPFNPNTLISYELPQESNVNIKIYNSIGKEIKTLVNEFKSGGQYQVNWDGTDNLGEKVSGGTYFCQLKADDYSQTRKMVLLK